MTGTLFHRALAAVAVTVAVLPTGAAHASNVGNPLGGTSIEVKLGHSISADITLAPVPNSLNAYTVVAVCTAHATPDAASTTMQGCSVNGTGITPVSTPGGAAVSVTAVSVPSGQTATACVSASAVYVEAVLGPITLSTGGCFPVRMPQVSD